MVFLLRFEHPTSYLESQTKRTMEEEKMERSKSDIELSTLRTRVSALRNQTTALAAKGKECFY